VPTTSSGRAWRSRVLRLGVPPAASTNLLNRADKLICRHGREIVVAVVGVIGVYLLAKGLLILLGR
jgi:hypothetical protein